MTLFVEHVYMASNNDPNPNPNANPKHEKNSIHPNSKSRFNLTILSQDT